MGCSEGGCRVFVEADFNSALSCLMSWDGEVMPVSVAWQSVMACLRSESVLVLEGHSVAESVAVGSFNVAPVGAVMFRRGAKIPAINGVEGPSAMGISLLVDLNPASQQS